MEADIVVVNHHLFFADLSIRKSDVAAILPDYSAVIFDEAHDLEDIATDYFGFHISNFRLLEFVHDARKLEADVDVVARASDRFFKEFHRPHAVLQCAADRSSASLFIFVL